MDAGRLEIRYRLAAGRFAALQGGVRRPQASRLLAGKSVADALTLLPRLYSLCGGAQLAVAQAACAAAAGRAPAPGDSGEVAEALGRRLAAEALREHLWRVMLDWPRALGIAPDTAQFARWHRRLGALAQGGDDASLVSELGDLVAGPLGELGARLCASLPAREPASAATRATPVLLPGLPIETWASTLRSAPPDFARQPTLDGMPRESGPLARHAALPAVHAALAAGRPLAARLLARLADLGVGVDVLAGQRPAPAVAAAVVSAGSDPGVAFGATSGGQAGIGVAGVDTARGWLMHRVAVAGERIADYAVIAPTEWNFHPQGSWLAEIAALPAPDAAAAEAAIGRVVLSLDPCVAVRCEPLADAEEISNA